MKPVQDTPRATVARENGDASDSYTQADLSISEVIPLTQKLIRIDSSNPNMGSTPGPGETAIAKYIYAWLQHRDIQAHWIEPTPGRPSVVGLVPGTAGDGKSLVFNGHMDTVTCLGYDGDALSGEVKDGKVFGRGSADMKSGLAACMLAIAHAKAVGTATQGDVLLAAVADEEDQSIGTEDVLRAGWRADAVVVAEPTGMDIINTHKGFAIIEVDILGTAAHSSRPDLGVDAITKAGQFLVEVERYAEELQAKGAGGSIHAGMIKGGEEIASYPAKCTISLERRTVAGETDDVIHAQLTTILSDLVKRIPDFNYDLRVTFSRAPFFIDKEHPFVELVVDERKKATSNDVDVSVRGEPYWTDMALMAQEGMAGVICGPKGYGLHSKTEWVEVESVKQLEQTFKGVVEKVCNN